MDRRLEHIDATIEGLEREIARMQENLDLAKQRRAELLAQTTITYKEQEIALKADNIAPDDIPSEPGF